MEKTFVIKELNNNKYYNGKNNKEELININEHFEGYNYVYHFESEEEALKILKKALDNYCYDLTIIKVFN